MADEKSERKPNNDRRQFFRESLSRILRPAADYIEQKLPIRLEATRHLLRPPGAIPEREFLSTCYRCGSCSDACPADAISLLDVEDASRRGTPYIDPDQRGCVVCDDLSCMKVCPSGALKLVDRHVIRIGLAKVDHETCVRSSGEDCTKCLESCPLGDMAIGLDENGRIQVIDPQETGEGCVGCGACQENCPTRPSRAIVIHPWA